MKPVWYTDGACSKNGFTGATGGFGVVCVDEDTDTIIYQHQEFHPNTTNNRMEMKAILHALIQAGILHLPGAPIIRSDSAYAINTFTSWMYKWERNSWKRSGNKEPENLDLVKDFFYLQEAGAVCILEQVKGHAGNKWNEYADKLATGAIKI